MTVYVDDMRAEFEPAHRPGRRYIMSHMIATSAVELHAMAAQIGVARRWFQRDHYDITQTKKAQALALGAVLIPQRVLAFMAVNRRFGWPMGTPETAEQIAKERWDRSMNIEALQGKHLLNEVVLDRKGKMTQKLEAAFNAVQPLMINGSWYKVTAAEPGTRDDYPVTIFKLEPAKSPYEP